MNYQSANQFDMLMVRVPSIPPFLKTFIFSRLHRHGKKRESSPSQEYMRAKCPAS
jgi:hypothetical protein